MPILGPFNPAELAKATQRLALAATRRVRPDHRAITARAVRFSPQNMVRLYLYVVVGPSRFATRPFDDAQVRRAQAFVSDAFPGVFDAVPTTADESQTLFAVEGEDGCRERTLYVHRTGLIELLWALTPEQPNDEELVIDTAEMTTVIAQLAGAVGRRPYAELSKAGRGRRRFARVDWWFHLATGVSGSTGPRYWTRLKFAGEGPPRAQGQYPAAPIDGYGWPRLRNSRRTKPADQVARTFLTELLAASGYYDFNHALTHTVERVLTPGADKGQSATNDEPSRTDGVESST